MTVFKNKKIRCMQPYNRKKIIFDPDSSPEAWQHYKKYYTDKIFQDYQIDSPIFFTWYEQAGEICEQKNEDSNESYNYISCQSKTKPNRLYAIKEPKEKLIIGDFDWYKAQLRLSGDTDFNFNDKHFPKMKLLLMKEENIETRDKYLKSLEICKDNHHRLLNFSLMQTVGNMQSFKGRFCDDRVDRLIFYINRYYNTKIKDETAIIKYASKSNAKGLIKYLDMFKEGGIYEYCEKVYFIKSKKLVDKLIKNALQDFNDSKSIMNYIDLACEFWNEKELYFSKKEYDVIGSYFIDGGEIYHKSQLLIELSENLGIEKNEAENVIQKSVKRGFLIDVGNDFFTR